MGNTAIKEPIWSKEKTRVTGKVASKTFASGITADVSLPPATDDREIFALPDDDPICHDSFSYPDWRETSEIVLDEKTGFELIVLNPGTILYRGTNLYASKTGAPPGFYGTWFTARNYAFVREYHAIDTNKIVAYRVINPIYLFNISLANLNHLVEYEEKETKDGTQVKYLKELMSNIFLYGMPSNIKSIFMQRGGVLGVNPNTGAEEYSSNLYGSDVKDDELYRLSSIGADYEFASWLCERGFNGFAFKRLDRSNFHSEVVLCSGKDLQVLPTEWRVFADVPNCISFILKRTNC